MWNKFDWERFKNSPKIKDLPPQEQARQYFLRQSDRMMESSFTNAVAASSAAGAGGGTLRRTIEYDEVMAKDFAITWVDLDSDTWKVVVYNFDTAQLSDIIDTGLAYNESNDWYLDSDEFVVSEKGHAITYQNSGTNKYKIVFVNSNGQLLSIKDLDNRKDFQYTENAQIFLGELDGISTCYHFDGSNVRTHKFPDVDIVDIEVDDSIEDDVTKDGSIIIEAPNGLKYFISRPNGDLVEVTNHMIGSNRYHMDYATDYIFCVSNSDVKIVSQEGELKNTFDLSDYSITSIEDSSLYGENSSFSILNTSSGYNLIVCYDGDQDQFVSTTFSSSVIYQYSYDEISWYDPKPYLGKTFILQTSLSSSSDSIGYLCTDLEIKWLPKGATSFQIQSFGSATVSSIDGVGNWTSNRTFSLGETPITMYAYPDSTIQVGFLTNNGFLTQSTGIQYASCSNVWGKPIGENNFAVFDVGSDRIWQIYGTNSIIAETVTTSNWTWGNSDNSVHRNGTLVVIDQSMGTQSFIWTSEIGLTAGPTNSELNIENSTNSGNRTGLTTEYQVLHDSKPNIEGGEFKGFYLVSKSGLSEFVSFTHSAYDFENIMIGPDLITIELSNLATEDRRLLNYKTSNLELIDDFESILDSVRLFNNRCLIILPEDINNNIYMRFVGANGVGTITVKSTSSTFWNTEANDPYDND